MTAPAAFQATFHALRTVGGRKVVQIVLETPIEHMAHVVQVLGSPNAESSTWVAVAKLNPKGESEARSAETMDKPRPGGRKRFSELPYSQQTALCCADPVFWRFLREVYGYQPESENDAADAIRERCNVQSRSAISAGSPAGAAWEDIYSHYIAWKQVA